MRLPKDLISKHYIKPRIFLCEPDKQRICQLDTTNTKLSAKFNSYSEVSFEVGRIYNNLITGQTTINPYFDKIEAIRLVEIEDLAYFEIQGPSLSSDGIKESKQVTAYSLEYTLSQKYLEEFYTVNGRDEWNGSLEDLWQIKHDDKKTVPSIVFYNPEDEAASLLHLIMEKIYGWKIGHVDESLWTMSRDFNVDRMSVYDFIMTEICTKFNCYAVFDTINNTINFYAESQVEKFIGDGTTRDFVITPPFHSVGTVVIDSYKISNLNYKYDATTGKITFNEAPKDGEKIEVVNGAMDKWETDVFITFENLSQEVNVSYDADSIKTMLTVTYGEDGTIHEVNLGLPYLIDLSYYYNVDWMGEELYEVYTEYLKKTNSMQIEFTEIYKELTELSNKKLYEENRMSLGYVIADSVNEETRGTYYIRSGIAPNFTYEEIYLTGGNFDATETYYMTEGCNLEDDEEGNVLALYNALSNYCYYYYRKVLINKGEDDTLYNELEESRKEALEELKELKDRFKFMEDYEYTIDDLCEDIVNTDSIKTKGKVIRTFLDKMWNELGRTPLQELYLEPYTKTQSNQVTDGYSEKDHEYYGSYYVTYVFVQSITDAVAKRTLLIDGDDAKNTEGYKDEIDKLNAQISALSKEIIIDNFFKKYFDEKYPDNKGQAIDSRNKALIRLSALLREDELHLDDIVDVETDTLEDLYATKRDALESGRIELQRISQPQLQFSMTMANIYALPEFEPIIDQFQLGKVIKVALRPDYIKQSRILQVDIGLDDFSDFSCEFGELTSLRTQSDIHADLLSQAISAGKQVATNASRWTKGSDTATKTEEKLQNGLLDAGTVIKSMDSTQNVVIDKYGIKLQKKDPVTGEIDKKQGWIVNNQFLYSDDGFETTKAVFGEYTVDGESLYGVLAEAVIAGYIEGSKIVGSHINIGNGAFVVDGQTGQVSMGGGVNHTLDGYATSDDLQKVQNEIAQINNQHKYTVEISANGSLMINPNSEPTVLSCKVYNWNTDITDTLSDTLFRWYRLSDNKTQDEIWNLSQEGYHKKTITITYEDTAGDRSTNFYCEVDLLPEEE